MTDTPKHKLADHLCHQAYALDRALNRAYQAAFGTTGFTYPKYIVLLALDDHGPMPISALSGHVGVEANTLTPLLKKMAGAGIVTRTRSEQDERQVLIAMTPLGERVLDAARASALEIYDAMGVSSEEAAALVETLSTLRERVSAASPTAERMTAIADEIAKQQG